MITCRSETIRLRTNRLPESFAADSRPKSLLLPITASRSKPCCFRNPVQSGAEPGEQRGFRSGGDQAADRAQTLRRGRGFPDRSSLNGVAASAGMLLLSQRSALRIGTTGFAPTMDLIRTLPTWMASGLRPAARRWCRHASASPVLPVSKTHCCATALGGGAGNPDSVTNTGRRIDQN